jgi:hypothetical protein
MGRQFGLAFDEIGTSLRLQYGSSPDSLLEGDGFELLVPRHKSRGFPEHSGHLGVSAGS